MTWLTPLTGVFVALAVIPPLILLYFLKLRRKQQPIASTLLWQRSVEDLSANAPFKMLRASLLLFLQLAILMLLVIAVMQPQVQGGRREGGRTVFLIDTSASMSATDGPEGRTRLEEAKRLARERVEAMFGGGILGGSTGEIMVIGFDQRGEIHTRFSRTQAQIIDAIDRIRPTHGQTNLDDALELARAYTVNPDPDSDRAIAAAATFELFSDGRIADLRDQVLRGEEMIYTPIGDAESRNVAVGTISVERPYDRPTAVEVFAALLNFSDEARQCDVELSVDGTVLAIESVKMPAGQRDAEGGPLIPGRNNIVFTPFEQPRGAVIRVRSLCRDVLDADNAAQLVVPPARKLRVALVGSSGFILREALEGLSLDALELLTPDRFEQLASADQLGQYDVVVLDDYAPQTLASARYLSFGATPPVDGLNEFGESEKMIVLDARDDHPVLHFVSLDNLFVGDFHQLQPADDIDILVEGSGGPMVVGISRGPLQMIHITFNPLDSNWPFLRSFITFLVNAIDYLGNLGAGLSERGFAPGDALVTRLPADATDIVLSMPDGTTLPLRPTDPARLSWGPAKLSGLYTLTWKTPANAEGESRVIAVNMNPELEGNIAPLPEIKVGAEAVTLANADSASYTPLWPYLITLALLMLMVEWWVYHRKATV